MKRNGLSGAAGCGVKQNVPKGVEKGVPVGAPVPKAGSGDASPKMAKMAGDGFVVGSGHGDGEGLADSHGHPPSGPTGGPVHGEDALGSGHGHAHVSGGAERLALEAADEEHLPGETDRPVGGEGRGGGARNRIGKLGGFHCEVVVAGSGGGASRASSRDALFRAGSGKASPPPVAGGRRAGRPAHPSWRSRSA